MTHGLVFVALLVLLPAAEPTLPAPKRITLGQRLKLGEALDALIKAYGVPIEDKRGEPDGEVQLNLKDGTFWETLDALAAAAHARVQVSPRDGRVTLVKRKATEKPQPVSRDDLFRAAVKRVTAVHDFDTEGTSYSAAIEIAWELRLQPLFLETQPRGLKVFDEKGKELPVRQEGSSLAPVDGRSSFLLELPLPECDRSATKYGEIRGTLTAIAPSRMLQLAFDPLDQLEKQTKNGPAPTVTQDGMTCKVTKVVLANERWSVQVALDYPPGGPTFESYQSWVVNNEMTLENKDGTKRLASNSYVLESSTSRRAVLTYHFTDKNRGKPEDWKLLYRTPASLVEIPFTFSFKDVPLP